MNFGELNTIARMYVLEAKKNKVEDTEIEILINNGAREVARLAKCLKTSEKFDSVADETTYNLTTNVTRFLAMDKPGLWYKASATGDYKKVHPKTIQWFDEEKPTWRNTDASDPVYYALEGDNIIITPGTDTAITDAFQLHFCQAPRQMTTSAHYPFGYETEIHRLMPLQEAILAFVEWKLTKALNQGADAYKAGESYFLREVLKQSMLVNERTDISSDKKTKFGRKRLSNGL